jgi:hypothetical protein
MFLAQTVSVKLLAVLLVFTLVNLLQPYYAVAVVAIYHIFLLDNNHFQ